MNDEPIRQHIRSRMVEEGIVVPDGQALVYRIDGREYIVLISIFDSTDWPKKESYE